MLDELSDKELMSLIKKGDKAHSMSYTTDMEDWSSTSHIN